MALEETHERERKQSAAFTQLPASLQARLEELPAFQDAERSEQAIIDRVGADPHTSVTAHSSTFTREDVDQWLAARISDPQAIELLANRVIRMKSVRMLSVDPMHPLMTTTEILAVEDALAVDAKTLAAKPSAIGAFEVDNSIRAYEQQEAERRGKAFRLSGEQRAALEHLSLGSLIAIEGLPGVGQTTLQGAVRVLGEQLGRDVVGLTLWQAAAERLESEAGFRCVNTTRARILEDYNTVVIPSNGIVVVDEAAMADSRANARILRIARERGSIVIEIGDGRQLQPIDFGASFRIVREVAQEAGTYSELRDIQRQERAWHREALVQLADAIAERDENARLAKVQSALRLLEEHGAITWVETRDTAINTAIGLSRVRRDAGLDALILASDRDSVRHLSEEDRRRSGREGQGHLYITNGGIREFTVGDRLMFLENSLGRKGLGVRNGDRGTVIAAFSNEIAVQLDGTNAKVVTFSPKGYTAFDYANACTVHKSQGASVDAAVSLIDRSASAELLFVAASRSKRELDIVVPRSAFADISDLAQHVAERISLKTTTRTYDELLERTGGKQTMRVLNIEAQHQALPMRRLYEADVVELLHALQAERIRQVRETYHERKRGIEASAVSIEERLDARREALREMRSAVATVYRELRPEPFGKWLQDREERYEHSRPLIRQQEREQSRQQSFLRAEELARSGHLDLGR